MTGLSRRGGGGGEQRVAAPDPHSGLVWEQVGCQTGWLAYKAARGRDWPLLGLCSAGWVPAGQEVGRRAAGRNKGTRQGECWLERGFCGAYLIDHEFSVSAPLAPRADSPPSLASCDRTRGELGFTWQQVVTYGSKGKSTASATCALFGAGVDGQLRP